MVALWTVFYNWCLQFVFVRIGYSSEGMKAVRMFETKAGHKLDEIDKNVERIFFELENLSTDEQHENTKGKKSCIFKKLCIFIKCNVYLVVRRWSYWTRELLVARCFIQSNSEHQTTEKQIYKLPSLYSIDYSTD